MFGDVTLPQLFIFRRDGMHLLTLSTTINSYRLLDAKWTPRGNIVFTTYDRKKVVIMSLSGDIIVVHSHLKYPYCLSVSSDGVIYLADFYTGVYQSDDDGVRWSLVFKSAGGWHCRQVIKVSTSRGDDFWTIESKEEGTHWLYHLRVYSVDRRRSDGNVTWKDINVTTEDGKHIDLTNSSLAYDGNMTIFLSVIKSTYTIGDTDNNAVYMLSVNGQYYNQLLSSNQLKNNPRRLTVDEQHQLLDVGQGRGIVGVFKLTYGNCEHSGCV